MTIDITKATVKDYQTIQNLARFYVYELSAYCDELKIPENGLFHCEDLKVKAAKLQAAQSLISFNCFQLQRYFEEADRYPFLIRVNGEIAGFALINKIGSAPIDWSMAEFFILAKFQNRGVGIFVAQKLFKMFPGRWEVQTSPQNTRAYHFWSKVVKEFTQGNFNFDKKYLSHPWNCDRLIFSFVTEAQ